MKQLIFIPDEKINRALSMIQEFLSRKKKKATLKEIQRLTGTLNFLSRCIIPGRPFTRRLYALTANLKKSHHHTRLSNETIRDLCMWQTFLTPPSVYNRTFTDFGRCNVNRHKPLHGQFPKPPPGLRRGLQ